MIDPVVYTLKSSRGDTVLTASTRELDPDHEYWLTAEPDTLFGGASFRGDGIDAEGGGVTPTHREPGAKTHELRMRIHLPSVAACRRERWRIGAALADGDVGQLVITGGGLPRMTLGVQRTGAVLTKHIAPTTFDFSIVVEQPDPWIYEDAQQVSVAPAGSGIGLVYPLYSPRGVLSYGAESAGTVGVLTNTGTVDAWLRFTVVGELPAGFRIFQDGSVIEWNGSAVRVPAVVDAARSTVEIGDADFSHRLSRDGFVPVRAGASTSIRFEPLGGGSGHLIAELRPASI